MVYNLHRSEKTVLYCLYPSQSSSLWYTLHIQVSECFTVAVKSSCLQLGKRPFWGSHHCRHEKYTTFSKFTLEKWFLLLFKIFLYLFLNKVLTTCLYPPWVRGSPLQNCLWFRRASHSTYVITEKAREDYIAAPSSQTGRILPIRLMSV